MPNVVWSYLENSAEGIFLIQCCPKSIKTTLNRIFLVQCCLERLGQHCLRLLPVQYCPKRIKTILKRIFLSAMLYGPSRTTLYRVFKTTLYFSVKCCPEPVGQHCTRFLPVPCCPKSIKTTLNRVFSCELLSGVS